MVAVVVLHLTGLDTIFYVFVIEFCVGLFAIAVELTNADAGILKSLLRTFDVWLLFLTIVADGLVLLVARILFNAEGLGVLGAIAKCFLFFLSFIPSCFFDCFLLTKHFYKSLYYGALSVDLLYVMIKSSLYQNPNKHRVCVAGVCSYIEDVVLGLDLTICILTTRLFVAQLFRSGTFRLVFVSLLLRLRPSVFSEGTRERVTSNTEIQQIQNSSSPISAPAESDAILSECVHLGVPEITRQPKSISSRSNSNSGGSRSDANAAPPMRLSSSVPGKARLGGASPQSRRSISKNERPSPSPSPSSSRFKSLPSPSSEPPANKDSTAQIAVHVDERRL
jgi:hypothetical protein